MSSQYVVNNSYLLCLYFESCISETVITATERSSSNTSKATTAASPVTAALLMIVPAVLVLGPRERIIINVIMRPMVRHIASGYKGTVSLAICLHMLTELTWWKCICTCSSGKLCQSCNPVGSYSPCLSFLIHWDYNNKLISLRIQS